MARLSTSNSEQLEILNRLAGEDADIDVRCTAISRLNNLLLLKSISDNDASEKAKEAANARLADVLRAKAESSPPLADRIAILKGIEDKRILESIVRDAEELELQIAAMELLEDQLLLSSVALGGRSAALRQAAASGVNDHELLLALSRKSKHHDKNVYRIVKQKLSSISEQAKESIQNQDHKEHLAELMEALSRSAYTTLYKSKYQHLKNQWHSIGDLESTDLDQRFSQAESICQQTLSQHEVEKYERQKHIEQDQVIHGERVEACLSIEGALDELRQSAYAGKPPIIELQRLMDHSRVAWKSAIAKSPPMQQEQKRFDRATDSLSGFVTAAQRLERKAEHIDRLLQQATALLNAGMPQKLEQLEKSKTSLETIVAQTAWPGSFPLSLTMNQANKTVEKLDAAIKEGVNNRGEILKRIESKLEQLTGYIDAGTMKSATGLMGEIRGLFNQLGNRKNAAIEKRFAELSWRFDELNDWRSFAATPKQEALIEKMERLVESELPIQDRANRIKELQDEWKSLGRGGKDRAESEELWHRFKQVADSAYEPCKEYFSAQRGQRKENLKQRKIICDELEHFIKSSNWDEADWKAVEKIVHVSHDEWKKHSPVDRSAGKQVQQRFDRLIGKINKKLKVERKANAALKQELVKQVEALVESEDLQAAINQTKKLQKEWRQIGITHRSDDQRLWKAFRSACDQIFGRRTQQSQAREQERTEQLKLAEALCEKLEQAAGIELASWDESAIHLAELKREFNSLGPLPRESQTAVEKRFGDAIRNYQKQSEKHCRYLEERKTAEAKRFSERCAEIEYGLISGGTKVPDAEVEQLRTELAASSIDDSFLRAIGARVDNVANSKDNPDSLISQLEDNLRALRLLCIRLEVLTHTESPAEDQGLRMEYQVNRLAEGMAVASGKPESVADQLPELSFEWLAIGPVERNTKAELQSRWDRVMENCSNLKD